MKRFSLNHMLASSMVLAVFLAACASRPSQDLPEMDGIAAEPGSLDNTFARIGLRIPGFAGIYVDAEEVVHVKLAGTAADTVPLNQVVAAIDSVGLLAPGEVQQRRVLLERSNTRYTWSDLLAFKSGMRDVLALPDVTFLDADERAGVVTVGIAKPEARSKVLEFAGAVGLPPDAWQIVVSPYRDRYADLTDQFRPMVGGIQLKNDAGPLAFLGFSGLCTLGVVADRGGATGFITNSHCTRVQGGTEQTNYYQNGRVPFSLDYVAHESTDPAWTASLAGCPSGSLCRRSDAAFAVIDIGNQNGILGSVARPTTLCSSGFPCSIAMGSPTARITLTGASAAPLLGTFVSKVGRTSGWTGGLIVRTCVDVGQSGSSFVVLCQSEFGNGSAPGDSGSPVVAVPASTPSGSSPVNGTLVGILWGGMGLTSTFSPISAVVAELGGIRLFPVPVSSGPPSPPVPACVQDCRTQRDMCMRSVATAGGPRPQECISELRMCLMGCP
ncbi:hypothetical protein LJR290_007676 [Variovorax sp. LjRoot290]|uniref:hypothetical protein n=1 Tax=Variovorax sp. LjRoot290 TaxID=3342316 RepID=UPI003ED122CF